MPVSHMGLTVSHLPTSCSFFLSALQPLGYRYIGQHGNQIGLGIHDADFFLCQETPGMKAGAAHIAFTAPSRTAVRDFYTAALTAGGRPNGAPSSRGDADGAFNAAIMDLDGNSIEVVFKNGPDVRDDGTVVHHSRVITWQRTVSETFHDDRSVVSARSTQSATKHADVPPATKAPSVVSVASKAPSIVRSVSEPTPATQAAPETTATQPSGDSVAKTIMGTLIGAAAGAAVAYAMVSSERDSAKKEADFNVLKQAKNMVSQFTQTKDDPQPPMQAAAAAPQVIHETQPKAILPHRNIGDTESHYSSSQRSVHVQRAIEAAPSDYHAPPQSIAPPRSEAPRIADYALPTYSIAPSRAQSSAHRSRAPSSIYEEPKAIEYAPAQSVAPSRAPSLSHRSRAPSSIYEEPKAIEYVPAQSVAPSRVSSSSSSSHRSRTSSEYQTPKAIEYIPAASVAPSRSNFSTHRSKTSPELLTVERARSTVSKAYSTAPSSLISSFVPEHVERKKSDGSIASKAKSSHSSHASSRHSSHSKAKGSSHSRAPSPPPSSAPKAPSKVASKAASIVDSIFGRDSKSQATSKHDDSDSGSDSDDFIDDLDVDDFNDTDTVAPSDSISNAGSRRSHRSHRSHRKHSHHGSSAESSASSRHGSSTSRRSSKSHHSSSSSRHHPHRSSGSPTSSVDGGSTRSQRLPTVISEPSDTSTVKPIRKSSASSASSVSRGTAIHTGTQQRKDSVTQSSDYDRSFKDKVVYGDGDVPVRGITQSMVDGVVEKHKGNGKSMMSYALGQRLRAFEQSS